MTGEEIDEAASIVVAVLKVPAERRVAALSTATRFLLDCAMLPWGAEGGPVTTARNPLYNVTQRCYGTCMTTTLRSTEVLHLTSSPRGDGRFVGMIHRHSTGNYWFDVEMSATPSRDGIGGGRIVALTLSQGRRTLYTFADGASRGCWIGYHVLADLVGALEGGLG